jgi:hypothetical protein
MSHWTRTEHTLPAEREYVRFLVLGHNRPLIGVYQQHSFRARWGAYDETLVGAWSKIGEAPRVPCPVRRSPQLQYWSERPMRES